ncbi:SET domain-containing protein-lysine N-methyltransferase [Planosporangium thailandense]|uniref:SET domain-containing protein-lysine N-methyltransferase n=1 Tax=Planosporangium thailandense TaxID=765197 RepID=UPI00197C8DC0|nr:SET domain-containing protein-lysine N-methyltransferase [Planosporangium thailandense]
MTQPVDAGGHLFAIDGELTDTPNRYTVQVGHALHVDLPESYGLELILDRFFWRFMNHSCEPTAVVRGREVLALKPLQPWQEITFHYNTTEYQMAEPFDCRCGSSRCEGTIQGFRYLSRSERERLRPWLSAHLLAILDGRVAEPAAAAAEEPLCR